MTNILILLGTVLATASFVPYIRAILHHGARPRLVSWVIWSLLLGLMAVVSAQERQWPSALATGISALGCLVVVCLGWRYATRDVTKLELVALWGAALGIILWFIADNPAVVMGIAIAVDGVAYIPTLIHGWQNPEEESWRAYAAGMAGEAGILLALMVQKTAFIGMVYPLYATLFGAIMLSILGLSSYRGTWYGEELAQE